MQKQCPSCGTTFTTKNSSQVRCSHHCDSLSRGRHLYDRQCPTCGLAFQVKNWRQRFCSRSCGQSQPKPSRRKPRITVTCKGCGAPFEKLASATDIFCSQPCYWQHLTTIYGEAHPQYRGPQHRPDLNRAAWLRLGRQLRAEAGHRCTRCGKAGRLVIHHIRSIEEAPELAMERSNLEVICQDCHNAIHQPVRSRWARRAHS